MFRYLHKAIARWLGHFESIPIKARHAIVERFAHPYFFRKSEPYEINLFQYKYRGDLSSLIDRYIYFYGAFEKSNLALMRDVANLIGQNCVFVDVGANVGQHSLWMSKFCKAVHAFEPWDKVREQMVRNINANKINTIVVHSVALGEAECEVPFYAPTATNNKGVGSFLPEHDIGNRLTSDLLSVVRADDYFSANHITPSFMKIDVEGYEARVLRGAVKTILETKPVILMEFSQSTRSELCTEEVLRGLLPKGYEIYQVLDTKTWNYKLLEFNFNVVGVDLLLVPPWLHVANGEFHLGTIA